MCKDEFNKTFFFCKFLGIFVIDCSISLTPSPLCQPMSMTISCPLQTLKMAQSQRMVLLVKLDFCVNKLIEKGIMI